MARERVAYRQVAIPSTLTEVEVSLPQNKMNNIKPFNQINIFNHRTNTISVRDLRLKLLV